MGGAQHGALSGTGDDHYDSRCTNRSGGNTARGRHTRARASNFRKSRGFIHVIRLIDVDGIECTVRRKGQMQTTGHKTVLNALSHRAINGNVTAREVPTHTWSFDETGMLDTSGLASSSDLDILEQEIREFNLIIVPEEVLQVHGYAPPQRKQRGQSNWSMKM
jgi:hypothetical protein